MNFEIEQYEIEKKYTALIRKELDVFSFEAYLFSREEVVSDDVRKMVETFKYLFSLGEEAKTYLWNKMVFYIQDADEEKLSSLGFSDEELAFVREMWACYKNKPNQHKDDYSKNINHPLQTERLNLVPFTKQMNDAYTQWFEDNIDEYEYYYEEDFSETLLSTGVNNQKERPLAFAINEKGTTNFVGNVTLTETQISGVYFVEYFIMPEYRKKGYAFEALNRMIEAIKNSELIVAFDTVRDLVYDVRVVKPVCLRTLVNEENLPSIKTLEKTGFECTGKELYSKRVKDKYINDLLYYYVFES